MEPALRGPENAVATPAAKPPPFGGRRHTGGNPKRAATGKVKLLTMDAIDGRTLARKNVLARRDAILADLGTNNPSEGQKQMALRAAVLSAIVEHHEALFLDDKPLDLPTYLSAISIMHRIFAGLGLKRQAKADGPNLGDYLAKRGTTDSEGA